MDYAHKQTDKMLYKLESEINIIYKESLKELKERLDKETNLKDIILIKDKKKRLLKMKERRRLQKLILDMANVIKNKNEIAINIINDTMIDIYSLNYNYSAYSLENATGLNLDYTLYNRKAVEELLKEDTPVFTKMAYLGAKDRGEIERDLRRELTKSILAGDSIERIASRIDKVTNKNNYGAIRIARTETTRIENSGRLKAYEHGEDMGIEQEKKWISTISKRTRKSHRQLNLEIVSMDKKFSNGLEYPGDPSGSAAEVINCRCTFVSEIVGIKKGKRELEVEEDLKTMSFKKWSDINE